MSKNPSSMIAITRGVSPAIGDCQLTHLPRKQIDFERAKTQHRDYEQCLIECGCTLARLPADESLPDSVFIEDTAVVLNELAIITNPGAKSRKAEIAATAEILKSYRALYFIKPPAEMDGGDVLVIGENIYFGLSSRSNRMAAQQLTAIVKPYGYKVIETPVNGCLHLKSAVTVVADNKLLINPDWIMAETFRDVETINVHRSEPYGANALWVGNHVLYSSAYPRTLRRLEQQHINCMVVDLSELAKAEGAVTCCSLIFDRSNAPSSGN